MKPYNFFILIILSLSSIVNGSALQAQSKDSSSETAYATKADYDPLIQPKVVIESFDWSGIAQSAKAVVIKNRYGSIRSRNQIGDEVHLHASIQMIGDSPLKPSFDIKTVNGIIFIEVNYEQPITYSHSTTSSQYSTLRGRTDVAILIPDTVGIYAETGSGMIKIDKTASHVEAVTDSGHIKLTTTGLFAVKSNTGPVSLRLRGQKILGSSSVTTLSGVINAAIFDDMSLELHAKTSGSIIENKQVFSGSRVIRLGSKLSPIYLKSESGNIILNVVKPPELVHSVLPSNVTSVDIDLRTIKKSKVWKPGDPIVDRDDKSGHLKKK